MIPVYNSGKYLAECLESIQAQSFREWEAVCVDDGSTDGSSRLLAAYAAADPRIRLLRQAHRGPGAARNSGMAEARGEYLYFMDSDDYLAARDALAAMARAMEEGHLDILCFGAELRFESDRLRERRYREKQRYRGGRAYGFWESGAGLVRAMVDGGEFQSSVFMRCARMDFLRRMGAAFPARCYYEDEVYAFRTLLQAGPVRHVDWKPYVRRVRESSVTTRPSGLLPIRDGCLSWRDMADFLAGEVLEEGTRRAAVLHLARLGQGIARLFRELPEERQAEATGLPSEERAWLRLLLLLEPVFRRQMASYCFPYHLFRRGARVAIYGAGNVGREFWQQAEEKGYVKCAGIVDKRAAGLRLPGIPVQEPGALSGMEYDAVLLAIQDKALAESARQELLEMGVPDARIAWDGDHYLARDFYEGVYFPMLDGRS